MATFQIRRGSSSAKGNLAHSEPYFNNDSQSVVFGASGSEEITLVKLNTGKTSNSKWSGSLANSGSLSITGDFTASNAYFGGNVFISGNLKLGDDTSDTINVVASLSSSLIPEQTNIHNVGSSTKYWKEIFVKTGSIEFLSGSIGNLTTFSSSLNGRIDNLNVASSSLNSYTASNDSINTTQNNRLNSLETESGSVRTAFNSYTSSTNGRLNSIEGVTGSYATTGSNTFIGNEIISGSVSISGGQFNVMTGSGGLTSSLTFTHNINAPSDGNAILELRHNNDVYNDDIAIKLRADFAGAYIDYEEDTVPYPILSVQSFANKNIYIHQDTRLLFSGLKIDETLNVSHSAAITGSLTVLGGIYSPSISGSFTGSFSGSLITQDGRLDALEIESASVRTTYNSFSQSINTYTSSLNGAIELTGSNVTIKGNLLVKGTQTTVNSTTVDIGDNIISLNGTGASNAGLIVRDATAGTTISGSLLWDTTNDYWKAGAVGSEEQIILLNQYNTFSSSINSRTQNLEIQSASFHSYSSSINNYTSSNVTNINAIHTSTASLNSYTASQNSKNDALFTATASLNSYTSSNNIVIGNLSAATSSLYNYTASTDLRLNSIETITQSFDGRLDSLETESGSVRTTYNSYTSSNNSRVNSLESESGSVRTDFNSFTSSYTTHSSSFDSRIDALEGFSASLDTSFVSEIEFGNYTGSLHSFTSSVNSITQSFDGRLDSLESVTASLNSATSSLFVSSSQLTSSLMTISSSLSARINNIVAGTGFLEDTTFEGYTASANGRMDSLELFTSSINLTYATDADLNLLSASFNSYTSSNDSRISDILIATSSLNSFSSSADGRLDSLESFTSSIDTTYATDADVTALRGTLNSYTSSNNGNISAIHTSTSSLNSYTASNNSVISSILISTSSLNSFSSSADSRLDSIESFTASIDTTYATDADVTALRGTLNTYTSSNDSTNTTQNNRLTSIESFTASIDTTYATDADVTALRGTLNSYTSSNNGNISAIHTATASLNSYTASNNSNLSALNTATASLNSFTSSINTTIKTRLSAEGVISGSSQVDLTLTTNYGTYINQAVKTTSDVQFNSLGVGMAASATTGRIDATNDIVAYSSSDKRFKTNIIQIGSPIEKIKKIGGYEFDWIPNIEHGYDGHDVGVIAQEIEAVVPELVQTRDSGYKAVKYDKLTALLIEAIKEQQNTIEKLEERINKLEAGK